MTNVMATSIPPLSFQPRSGDGLLFSIRNCTLSQGCCCRPAGNAYGCGTYIRSGGVFVPGSPGGLPPEGEEIHYDLNVGGIGRPIDIPLFSPIILNQNEINECEDAGGFDCPAPEYQQGKGSVRFRIDLSNDGTGGSTHIIIAKLNFVQWQRFTSINYPKPLPGWYVDDINRETDGIIYSQSFTNTLTNSETYIVDLNISSPIVIFMAGDRDSGIFVYTDCPDSEERVKNEECFPLGWQAGTSQLTATVGGLVSNSACRNTFTCAPFTPYCITLTLYAQLPEGNREIIFSEELCTQDTAVCPNCDMSRGLIRNIAKPTGDITFCMEVDHPKGSRWSWLLSCPFDNSYNPCCNSILNRPMAVRTNIDNIKVYESMYNPNPALGVDAPYHSLQIIGNDRMRLAFNTLPAGFRSPQQINGIYVSEPRTNRRVETIVDGEIIVEDVYCPQEKNICGPGTALRNGPQADDGIINWGCQDAIESEIVRIDGFKRPYDDLIYLDKEGWKIDYQFHGITSIQHTDLEGVVVPECGFNFLGLRFANPGESNGSLLRESSILLEGNKSTLQPNGVSVTPYNIEDLRLIIDHTQDLDDPRCLYFPSEGGPSCFWHSSETDPARDISVDSFSASLIIQYEDDNPFSQDVTLTIDENGGYNAKFNIGSEFSDQDGDLIIKPIAAKIDEFTTGGTSSLSFATIVPYFAQIVLDEDIVSFAENQRITLVYSDNYLLGKAISYSFQTNTLLMEITGKIFTINNAETTRDRWTVILEEESGAKWRVMAKFNHESDGYSQYCASDLSYLQSLPISCPPNIISEVEYRGVQDLVSNAVLGLPNLENVKHISFFQIEINCN